MTWEVFSMKAKKVVALMLSTIMAFSLAGCGGSKEAAPADNAAATTDTAATTEAAGEEAAPEAMQGSVEGELTVTI